MVEFDAIDHLHPSLIFAGKARSLPIKCNPIRSSTLAISGLTHNIRQRGKLQTASNTLAYYDTEIIMAINSFKVTRINVIKLFSVSLK